MFHVCECVVCICLLVHVSAYVRVCLTVYVLCVCVCVRARVRARAYAGAGDIQYITSIYTSDLLAWLGVCGRVWRHSVIVCSGVAICFHALPEHPC